MILLITYDVNTTTKAGQKRLRTVAKICNSYGFRVQNSVFECDINPAQLVTFKNMIIKAMDPSIDSIRIYQIEHNKSGIEHFGIKKNFDLNDVLIV